MRRRQFLTLLGGAAAWPVAARAQQSPRKVATIGYIGAGTMASESEYTAAFLQRLRDLGWIEGRNTSIEYRWAQGRADAVPEFVAEFVRLKVDVILLSGNNLALAAKRATSAIPIVFAEAGDPVGTGIVASLAQPGGNVTGLSNQLPDAAGKRVELLRQVVPGLRRLGMMTTPAPLSALEAREVDAAADRLGVEVLHVEIRKKDDIAQAFDTLGGRADALYVSNSAFLGVNKMRVAVSALGMRLPTIYSSRSWLEAGGLMSYGTNFTDRFRRSAELVDKILHGAKPEDIPVEQPTKFELVVNLVAARALGLAVPPTLLALADEVIE
jgi:putative ABC transport system substrate-binding protein